MGLADYSLDRELQSLAHETTYEATHVLLPRRARIRVAADRAFGARYMREACVLEALRHPGVPRVFDCGVHDGRPWIATELIEGKVLEMPVEARELVDVLRDVGAILAHAHSRGVIHGGLWLDAVVRDDGTRGFPYSLVQWSEARFAERNDGRRGRLRARARDLRGDAVERADGRGGRARRRHARGRPGRPAVGRRGHHARIDARRDVHARRRRGVEEVALIVDLYRASWSWRRRTSSRAPAGRSPVLRGIRDRRHGARGSGHREVTAFVRV